MANQRKKGWSVSTYSAPAALIAAAAARATERNESVSEVIRRALEDYTA